MTPRLSLSGQNQVHIIQQIRPDFSKVCRAPDKGQETSKVSRQLVAGNRPGNFYLTNKNTCFKYFSVFWVYFENKLLKG